jgi:CheY-like chemotaxis protein
MENVALDLSHYRILVVDDSPELLNNLRRLLEVEGCKIVTAASHAEALTHIQQQLFHLAVIDVRLVDTDPRNREGLQLVRELRELDPSVGIIIMSVHADIQDVLDMIQTLPGKTGVFEVSRSLASRFIYKTPTELEKLPEVVYQVFQDVVQIDWALKINDPRGLVQAMACDMHCSKPPEQLSVELDELLRKLFAANDRIDLIPIAAQKAGYSKAHVIQVDRYEGGEKGATQIVKIGEHPLIEREIMRFREHIGRLTNVNRYPVALSPIHRTRTLGAMIYTFLNMNGRIVDFAQVYHYLNNQEKIEHLLTNLFTDTLSMQRRHTHGLFQGANMGAVYMELLRLDRAELVAKQEELLTLVKAIRKGEHAKKFYLRDGTGLLNPTEFALTETLKNDYYEATIHGDLHGRNVLVDRRWDTWLIDFADMGRGPMLQDFITMESWLLISSIDQVGWTPLFTWSKAQFSSRDEFYPGLPEALKLIAPISKAHRSILTVRRLALEGRMGDQDVARRAYLIGLLFTLLRLMTSKFLPSLKRFHALICASLIAGLLDTSPRKTGLLL